MRTLPRQFEGRMVFVADLSDEERAAQGLAHSGSIVEVVSDPRGLERAIQYAYETGITSFDLETGRAGSAEGGLDPFLDDIILCQLGDEEKQFLLWWQTLRDVRPVLELLRSEAVCKVGVNLKFDQRFMYAKYGIDARGWNLADCQLVEQITSCGLLGYSVGHTMGLTGMEEMAERWCGFKIPKDLEIRTGWGAMTPGDWSTCPAGRGEERRYYAADDVVHPIKILRQQKPWIIELGLTDVVKLEHAFLPVLAESEIRGLKMDWPKWSALAEETDRALAEATKKLDELFDVRVTVEVDEDGTVHRTRDKNYGSSEQFRNLLRQYMKEHHGITVVASNQHLEEELAQAGLQPEALARMFEKSMVPNPDKPGTKMQKGYPNMTDYVEKYWKDYRTYLPRKAFFLPDTESSTLLLMKIIWETPADEVDEVLPTDLGLPPALVDPVLDFREYSTKQERYGWSWASNIHPATGRIHTSFSQCATNTLRMSSSPNIQNLPADPRYRECFVPDTEKDHIFVGSDYSQIEPRIIAEMSLEPTYMRVFWSEKPGTKGFEYWCGADVTEPLDLYVEIAKAVGILATDTTLSQCKGDQKTVEGEKGRKRGKVVVLGLGYGAGKKNFHTQLILDTKEHHRLRESSGLYDDFFDAVPRVKAMLDHCSELAIPKDSPRKVRHPAWDRAAVTWAESLGGGKRFFKHTAKNAYTEGRNFPVQNLGALILKRASVAFTRWLWTQGVPLETGIVNYAHDELIVECPREDAERMKQALSHFMVKAGERYLKKVPVVAESWDCAWWRKE